MSRVQTRTRIADIVTADKSSLGLATVFRWTPRATANWELPILFVSGTTETTAYRQHEKLLNRDQTWLVRVLMQEMGLGWTEDIENRQDTLIDALFTLFNGNPNLRLNDAGLEGVDVVQWAGVRIVTPYSFPTGQSTKMYHTFEMPLLVRYSQLC